MYLWVCVCVLEAICVAAIVGARLLHAYVVYARDIKSCVV